MTEIEVFDLSGVGPEDCRSERRRALSRLFYDPVGHFRQTDVFPAVPSQLSLCSPDFRELVSGSGLLNFLPESENLDALGVVADLIQGTFPTGELAIQALSLTTNPRRLQENLFGGAFLKDVGRFNFSGAVGTSGTLSFRQVFTQVGLIQDRDDLLQLARMFSEDSMAPALEHNVSDSFGRSVDLKRNRDSIRLISEVLESERFFKTLREAIKLLKAEQSSHLGALLRALVQPHPEFCETSSATYVPRCTDDGEYQEIQCQDSECWCVDAQGLEVMGSRSTGATPRCPSQCEKERARAIVTRAASSAGSEVFIPMCQDDGGYVPVQCLGKDCFCVDASGARLTAPSPRAALQCEY